MSSAKVISASTSDAASSEASDAAAAKAAHVASAEAAHVASAATTVSAAATAAGLRPTGKQAAGKQRACQNHHRTSSHDILLLDRRNFRHMAQTPAGTGMANAGVAMD